MATIQYNGIIRKLVIGFGNVFNQIQIARYNTDGSENERFLVPIAYAGKENYVARLQGDPNLDKKVQITLPAMSFEITGMKYDASRKQNTNQKNFAYANGGLTSQYNPVPYDFDFSLFIYVRNVEDGTQIIERILPYFTPDYTMKLNLIPEMGVVKEVPIVLNNVSHETTYEGDMSTKVRSIIWELNFTAKAFLYGPYNNATSIVKTVITNILEDNSLGNAQLTVKVGSGTTNYMQNEIVYQGPSLALSSSQGRVRSWNSNTNQLILTNTSGNFLINSPIVGADSNTNRLFLSYTYNINQTPTKLDTITITPYTANANVQSFTYNVSIQEANSRVVSSNSSTILGPRPLG
jgi:hypothetical protein